MKFNEILKFLQRTKIQRCRKLNAHFYDATVDFKGVTVKIFFCKPGKHGIRHGILTTDTKQSFEQIYKIYATRWTTEVFFEECRQYLRLGKCESRDFDAQIAATTLCMLQYNLFSEVRRFDCYGSFGALFRAAKSETLELSVRERIYLIIKEITLKLFGFFVIDIKILYQHIATDNEELAKLINIKNVLIDA